MSSTVVQQNAAATNGASVDTHFDSQDISPLGQIFSQGSLSDPEQATVMAQSLLDLNAQSPFLTEEEAEQLQGIVDGLGSDSVGEQIMALDRFVGLLINIHPGDSAGGGVDLASLETLDEMITPLADSYRSFLEEAAKQSSPAEQLGALQKFSDLLGSTDLSQFGLSAANIEAFQSDVTEMITPLADSYRSFLGEVANKSSPAEQLGALQKFSDLLGSTDLSQFGLSAANIEAFQSEVADAVDSYKQLLNTESAVLVGTANSWESFVGHVNDLKGALESLGVSCEGSAIGSFIAEYGSKDSMKNIGELDLLEQRSMVVSFKSELLTELEGAELSPTFVHGGVDKAREQLSVEESIFAVGEVMQQDEYRTYLTDAKSVLMGDGGSLAGATADDFELYKSNLQAIADRRYAELGIPSDPAYRTPAQQKLADDDILLAMVDGSMEWANKWEAKAGTGSLTKQEAFKASIELITLDAGMFKTIQNHVASEYGTDSEIYMIVTSWFEKASEVLLKVKDLLKMASHY